MIIALLWIMIPANAVRAATIRRQSPLPPRRLLGHLIRVTGRSGAGSGVMEFSLDTGLLKQWPAGGPAELWETKGMGVGEASRSCQRRVFCMCNDSSHSESMCALDEITGAPLWKCSITDTNAKSASLGFGSCSTPAVDGDRVYALGGLGYLACVDASTGRLIWQKDLKTEFGKPQFTDGYYESPLVDENKVLVTPCGDVATIVALNKFDGATLWKSAVPKVSNGQYSSIMPMSAGGRRFYVQSTQAGMGGFDAESGAILWSSAYGRRHKHRYLP